MALQSKYKICLDIGGTKILGAIFDDDNKIIYRLKKRTKADNRFDAECRRYDN